MFCSVRRLKKWNESIKMKMFLSADTLLWELVMKDSEWHSERSDKHGSLFAINTGKFPLQHEPDQPLRLVSCLPSSELQLSHHQQLQKVSGVAASPHESSGRLKRMETPPQTDVRPSSPQLQQSQERSKLTAEGTVWVKDVTGWLQWLATQWRAAAVLGLNSWK